MKTIQKQSTIPASVYNALKYNNFSKLNSLEIKELEAYTSTLKEFGERCLITVEKVSTVMVENKKLFNIITNIKF